MPILEVSNYEVNIRAIDSSNARNFLLENSESF